MACVEKLFVNSAYDIPIIEDATSITVADIADIEITLFTDTETKIFKKSLSQIDITGSDITLLILEGDIMEASNHKIKIDIIDNSGKRRKATPCPPKIKFFNQ
jgi:hypothetical protein